MLYLSGLGHCLFWGPPLKVSSLAIQTVTEGNVKFGSTCVTDVKVILSSLNFVTDCKASKVNSVTSMIARKYLKVFTK